jgi:hypothetical protein
VQNHPKYILESGIELNAYSFNSEGPNGTIPKLIVFSPVIEFDNSFNLGFGDYKADTGDIDDMSISNNDDRDKILATIVDAILIFTKSNPSAVIFATGSTPARTRLYQISITKNLEEAKTLFKIFGIFEDGTWEIFTPNKNYFAFAIKKTK